MTKHFNCDIHHQIISDKLKDFPTICTGCKIFLLDTAMSTLECTITRSVYNKLHSLTFLLSTYFHPQLCRSAQRICCWIGL